MEEPLSKYQLIIIGLAVFNVLAAFIYWPLVSRIKGVEADVKALISALAEFKLLVSKDYTSKTDTKDHLERQEKVLSEIKAYFMAKHDQ